MTLPAGAHERRGPEPGEEDKGRDEHELRARAGSAQALYFFGVTRARGFRPIRRNEDADIVHIRYRDLDALVRPTTFEMPALDEGSVLAHQRVIERAMRRGTVLPAPYGIVLRGRRQLIRMLEDQYLVLDDGLAFLDGHWELRVHIQTSSGPDSAEQATQFYAELRRFARASVPFTATNGGISGAAYLVERSTWLEFMTRAEELASAHHDLTLDITGPWPPYDFVRVTR